MMNIIKEQKKSRGIMGSATIYPSVVLDVQRMVADPLTTTYQELVECWIWGNRKVEKDEIFTFTYYVVRGIHLLLFFEDFAGHSYKVPKFKWFVAMTTLATQVRCV